MGLNIKKGDTVMVLSGKSGGERGTVLEVRPKKGVALVEGLNMITKHTRARSQDKPGGLVKQEAPIPLCKLMLVDPKTGIAGRYRNETNADGDKIRRSKLTGNEV